VNSPVFTDMAPNEERTACLFFIDISESFSGERFQFAFTSVILKSSKDLMLTFVIVKLFSVGLQRLEFISIEQKKIVFFRL
jgi:hypothetical protein